MSSALVLQDNVLANCAFLPPGLPANNGAVRIRAVSLVEKRAGRWQVVFQQLTPQAPLAAPPPFSPAR